ncbi:protein n-terminal asparagine amidohydrolase [Moniliophthora roreri MCA 2997]|uniref:Protein n-terminal asparagine amidohydrolase n=1 Tax=Moniliophthora roreri (strain MCA 2997) TaxID=1381753 RepID=V2X6B1_MONRO|nr:protein n-terminal asparagine amidohydrolase [Moniliophthora roreri MCA 2997]
MPRIPLRIAVVQFCPKIGHVQANIARARELCRKIEPRSVDLLCFPEMIFSGYVFDNPIAISPHLEALKTGPTSQFCSEIAKQLKCYIVAGYPERLGDEEHTDTLPVPESASEIHARLVGANSAVLCGPEGEWVGNYRKSNLFEVDMPWAKPGTGFATFDLPSPLRRMTLGICMDLNVQPPAEWVNIEEGPYELASYTLSKQANILVLLNAWLDSGKDPEEESDWSTLNYWAMRLRPLWARDGSNSASDSDGESTDTPLRDEEDGPETVVVVCNRSGEENGKVFAGSSAIYSMRKGADRPKLLDMMGRTEEGVRIWNILV